MNSLANPRIALALSGGGFRAAIFHLGVLRRLAELGWLSHIDVISTVSGGSILGGFAAIRWSRMENGGDNWGSLESAISKPFLELVRSRNFIRDWVIRVPKVAWKKIFDRSYTRTKLAAELLGKRFFESKFCSDLPQRPYLILNTTNLQSMRAWRFTRKGMGDSRTGHAPWKGGSVPLGEAAGASAAFPPVFPPARIRRTSFEFRSPVYGEKPLHAYPIIALTDGGVYDNLGVEVVWKKSVLPAEPEQMDVPTFLIVSDAGYPAQFRFRPSGIPGLSEALLLYRADDIAREQVTALRQRELVRDFADAGSKRKGLLVALKSHLGKIPNGKGDVYSSRVGHQFRIPDRLIDSIQGIRTNLDRFSPVECEALTYHAYTMTDAFLWAHRETCPEEYRVPTEPTPSWKIEFTASKIQEWERGLKDSNRGKILS